MLRAAGSSLVGLPWLLSLPACASRADEAPLVQTQAGTVRGVLQAGAAVFKGVVYGASTRRHGALRGTPAGGSLDGIRDATAYGPRAPGPGYPPFLMREEGVDLDTTPFSEDGLVRADAGNARLLDSHQQQVRWHPAPGRSLARCRHP